MSDSPLVKKLHVKSGHKFLIINPPDGFSGLLGQLPPGVTLAKRAAGQLDAILLFVGSIADLEKSAPKAIRTLVHDGLLWIAYPKKTSKIKTDISRDVGWDIIKKNGLRGIASISIDTTWSAIRFRPLEKVGK